MAKQSYSEILIEYSGDHEIVVYALVAKQLSFLSIIFLDLCKTGNALLITFKTRGKSHKVIFITKAYIFVLD